MSQLKEHMLQNALEKWALNHTGRSSPKAKTHGVCNAAAGEGHEGSKLCWGQIDQIP